MFIAGGLMVLVGFRPHRRADGDREGPRHHPPAALAVVVTLLRPMTSQALHCGALLRRRGSTRQWG